MNGSTQETTTRVLVLAGDPELGEAVRRELAGAGFAADVTRDPSEARRLAGARCHDAFLVDTSIPDGAAYRLVAELREAGREEPVLLLSAPHAAEDLLAVQRGWGDFQPVVREGLHDAPRVVTALLRHERPDAARRLHYGGIALDRLERRACVNGEEIRVTPAEWDVLEHLLSHAEHLVERATLELAVWGPDPDLSSNALDVHIGHLRRKLRRAECTARIETVRGRGYLLRMRPDARETAA